MERDEVTKSSALYQGERGAGGKFRKPPLRKPPTTPYDRPNQTQTQTQDGGWWLSKLVVPASRLLTSGATRLIPSFFSKPLVASPASPPSEPEHSEVKQEASDGDLEHISNIRISRSTEEGLRKGDRLKCCSDIDERMGDKLGNSSDASGLSEIEQLMKEKTFSRDDLNRLTEILHSRITDHSDVDERGKETPNVTTGAETTDGSLGQENLGTSAEDKQTVHLNRAMGTKNPNVTMGAEAAGGSFGQENPRTPINEKQAMHLNRVMGEISNPYLQSTIRDQVGASPVDIAKAYMGARTSELGLSSPSVRDGRSPLPTDGFSSKSSIPLPSPKSSICWPGAMVQDQRAYLTPQTQRGRIGLHNLPRTPYSRTVHSRSTSKLQGGGDRALNISSNHWKQSQTPVFGDSQVTRTRSSLDDDFGSVGPVRRTRQKFGATPSKGAGSSHPARTGPLGAESSDASIGFLPMTKQNLEIGASTSSIIKFQPVDSKALRSDVGVSTVHPRSSEMARKILEHLDRTVPSPKEKSAELKLATSWRKIPSSELTTSMPNGQFSKPHVESSDSHRNIHIIGQRFSAQGNEVRGSSLLKVQPEQRKTNEATDAINRNTLASNTVSNVFGFGCDGVGLNARPSMDFKKTHDFQVNRHEVSVGLGNSAQSEKNHPLPLHNQLYGQDASRLVRSDAGSEALNVQKKPPTHTFGSKPALTSISVARPDPKCTFSLDNGSGFTFPVSASFGAPCEPPTPSITPSLSASGLPRPKEETTVPSYSFGSNTAGRTLVFSFPSTSTSTPGDASTPKFNFGSDKKVRISFRSVGEDAICY